MSGLRSGTVSRDGRGYAEASRSARPVLGPNLGVDCWGGGENVGAASMAQVITTDDLAGEPTWRLT